MSLQKVTYGFIPTSITGCVLWMDAADSSTITLSSTAITQWNDKSASANHFVQATTANSPTVGTSANGLPTVYFATDNKQLVSSQNNATTGNASRTVIQVFWCPTLSSAYYSVTGTESGANPAQAWGHAKNANSDVTYPFMYSSAGNDVYSFVYSTPNPLITYAQYDSTASSLNSYYATSGATGGTTTVGNFTTKSCTFNTTAGVWYLGRRQQAATGSITSHLLEMIHFNKALSATERQQVEGYLIQKWALTGLLSAGHPGLTTTIYRADYQKTNIAKPIPYYLKFSPKSVPNCLIWFDAADSTTLGLTGTTVNTWTSKGSYTGNAAASTGTVVSGTVTQNGVNVVRFAAGTQLAFTMAVPNQARAWFSVTRCTTQLSQATNPSFWGIIDSPSSGAGEEAITGQVYGVPATNSYTVSLLQPGIADIVKTTIAADSYQIWTIISHVNSAVSTANNIITINGTSQTLAISSLASGYRTSSYTKIINKASLNSGMDVGEIIMYNGEITSTQRQQVESYLAQKWGLTASLPGGHLHLTQQAGAVTTVALSKYRMVGLPRIIFTATGGTIVTSGFKYHLFTSSSNFVVSMDSKTVNYLVVGGGGGGGDRHGGGGGGGGVLTGTWTASVGTYTVTVGSGGQYGATAEGGQTVYGSPAGAGSKGGDSLLSGTGISVTAYGGGGGGTYEANPTGTVGSGGGGGGNSFAGIAGTAGQGNAGGAGLQPAGGGGGGAGGVGADANTSTGGIGTTSFSTHLLAVGYGTTFAVPTAPNAVISGGVAYIAAGGGGAAASAPGPGGYGGLGGGGLGDWDASYILAGTANTGGGGGGSRSNDTSTTGRNGGSGLVLLWYAI